MFVDQEQRFSFEPLAESAKEVLRFSEEEARALRRDYVGTEHLLLGLMREEIARTALTDLGIDTEKVRKRTIYLAGRSEQLTEKPIQLTPQSRNVFQLARQEAERSHRLREINSIHLLRAVVRQYEGIGAGVLESFGLDRQNLDQKIPTS